MRAETDETGSGNRPASRKITKHDRQNERLYYVTIDQ